MAIPPLIDISGLSIGLPSRRGRDRPVLRDVSLQVCPGESVGIVGESGSGKSTLALAALGYLRGALCRTGGDVRFDGKDVFALPGPALERMRGGDLGLIPQNSGQALTPTMRVGHQIAEALRLHSDTPSEKCEERVRELLEQVRLPDAKGCAARYPHELSGGQQQRVAVALALAGNPRALLLDEPTTGLDVTTQAHILRLLRDIAAQRDMAMVYVSHDLGAVAQVCERTVVMYAGQVVLEGPTRGVLRAPRHPYARGLLASIPRLREGGLPRALDGRPPGPGEAGPGCAFADRCALAIDACRAEVPPLVETDCGSRARCIRLDALDSLPAAPGPRPDDRAVATGTGTVAPALDISGLCITYNRRNLIQRLAGAPVPVATVDGIDLQVPPGETLALVGESGSGKSTILKAIAGMLEPEEGSITVAGGAPLAASVERRDPSMLRKVQIVFQNPDDSLNPRHSVADILAQPLRLYEGLTGEALRTRAADLLSHVRLGAHYLDRLPAQLSGGEKQRVAVARAFAADPDLVLCDEVTSALDVSVQAAVLDLLRDLQARRGTSYVFVSHDLAVVRALADRVAVLYQGRICEMGETERVYSAPSHPYTEALLGAVLEPDPDTAPRLMTDDRPEHAPPARGCPFQRRCPRHLGAICDETDPPWHRPGGSHALRCHIAPEDLAAAATPEKSRSA